MNSPASLPWLATPLRDALRHARGHAVLVHGPRGVGQFELALDLATAWLCESTDLDAEARPCRRCASCKLVAARTHPDLIVLLPEAVREALGWSNAADDDAPAREGKAKPSKDIRVEEVRRAIAFAQTTTARGRAKVLVLHPAERMNPIAANALLKTLEEPPGTAKLVLSTATPELLLPTIRSRCQGIALGLPPQEAAQAWLAERGMADAATLLAACGGQPQDALDAATAGIDAATWKRLPAVVARGEASLLAGWPLPRLVESLQKLCHDALCIARGAAPRYFPAGSITLARADDAALSAWWRALTVVAEHDEHPWNAALLADSLVEQGRKALAGAPARGVQPLNSTR